jgi:hypothetical protein
MDSARESAEVTWLTFISSCPAKRVKLFSFSEKIYEGSSCRLINLPCLVGVERADVFEKERRSKRERRRAVE